MHTTSLYGQTDAKVFLVTVSDLDALKKKKTKGCNIVFAHARVAFTPAGMTYKCYFHKKNIDLKLITSEQEEVRILSNSS